MVPLNWDEITNRYRWGKERWNPLDDDEVKRIWTPPAATQAKLLLPTHTPPTLPPLTTASTFDDTPPDMLPNGDELATDFTPGGRIITLTN